MYEGSMNRYQKRFHDAIIKPYKDVQNFRDDLKSGKKDLNEISTYSNNSLGRTAHPELNLGNYEIYLNQAVKLNSPTDYYHKILQTTAKEIYEINLQNSICDVFMKLDISCHYTTYENCHDNKNIKVAGLEIDGNPVTVKNEKDMVKSLSDSYKCTSSHQILKCVYEAITGRGMPSDNYHNKLTECKNIYNVSDVSQYTKFITSAFSARAEYLDKLTPDALLDSSDIAEECYFCTEGDNLKELAPEFDTTVTLSNAES